MADIVRAEALRRSLDEQLGPVRVPGAVVAVAREGGPAIVLAHGAAADGQPLTPETLFPVASITKLATALTVLRMVDSGTLGLDDPLTAYLPDAAAAGAGVTLRGLLCHSAGLPLDLNTPTARYAPGLSWRILGEACLATPRERAPGERVQYSNVGYGLLACMVERVAARPFSAVLADLVLDPLGIEGFLGDEPPQAPAQLADVRGEHSGGPLEPFNSRFWRSLALPWAGLITNAAGALALVRAYLGVPPGFLSTALRLDAIRNQTGDLAGGFIEPMDWARCPWGLGPELRGEKQPHWAPAGAPDSFGHSGASGCLAWADPGKGVAWAILGARTADNGWLLRRGPAISAAVVAALEE